MHRLCCSKALRDPPRPGIKLLSPALAGRFFTTEHQGSPKEIFIQDCCSRGERLGLTANTIMVAGWLWLVEWVNQCIESHQEEINQGRFSLNSVQFSPSVMFESLWPHGLYHTRLPCPSPSPGVYSNSCPLSWWCHPTISSSVVPFSSCLQSFPASESFPMTQFFASGGQSIGVSASASVLPMNIKDWFPLGWTGWISLQSRGLSRAFSNTTVQKHQFFSPQLS